MIRPVVTRWNTFSGVVDRALALRPALAKLCDKVAALRKFKSTDLEWELLGEIQPILLVCGLRLLFLSLTDSHCKLVIQRCDDTF